MLKPIKQKVPYKILFGLLFKIGLILSILILPIRPDNITRMKNNDIQNMIKLTLLKI